MCGTKVEDVSLGLRDYRWLGGVLPGKVAPTDIDFLLETNNDFLVMEFKPKGVPLTRGQAIAMKRMVKKGFEVRVVWGEGDLVDVGDLKESGRLAVRKDVPKPLLALEVGAWFAAHVRSEVT
jgi:hypothetical protein